MSTIARLIAVVGLIVVAAGTPLAALATQDAGPVIDIADIPVPVDDLPEAGYQVLAGGYLDQDAAAAWIAAPRQRSAAGTSDDLSAAGWVDAYVMDLALLQDRAYATSDILALVQTNVFVLADATGAENLFDAMRDFSGADVEEADPAIRDASTVRLVSQSGDTLRTVFQRDRLVIEVVSLDVYRAPDEAGHSAIVTQTVDRAERALDATDEGIAPRTVRLVDGDDLADFQNIQQSGVHQVYRIRDGRVQPAAGEVRDQDAADLADGIQQLFYASEGLRLGGGTGTGFMSTWIGTFGDGDQALAFMETLDAEGPTARLADPYFTIAEGEQATPQGVAGLYRVSGMLESQPYSGTLEVRQHGPYVVAIGFRTLGSALPPVDVTSRVMDHQLACLDAAAPCPPLEIGDLLAAPSATPVAPAGTQGLVVSQEFGWSVHTDTGDWTVTEQFSESGYDFIELHSGRSLVTLESVIDQQGDPQQCVINELDALRQFESSAVIDLGSDLPDEAPAGMEPGHAWAVYTVEPLADERADQEYTIRIDCYTLIEGGANLIVTHRAPRDEWATEREKGSSLRETIALPSSVVPARIVARMAHPWTGEWRQAA